jgi:hypothetical protein
MVYWETHGEKPLLFPLDLARRRTSSGRLRANHSPVVAMPSNDLAHVEAPLVAAPPPGESSSGRAVDGGQGAGARPVREGAAAGGGLCWLRIDDTKDLHERQGRSWSPNVWGAAHRRAGEELAHARSEGRRRGACRASASVLRPPPHMRGRRGGWRPWREEGEGGWGAGATKLEREKKERVG